MIIGLDKKKDNITIRSKVYDGPDRQARIDKIYEKLLKWTIEAKEKKKQINTEGE